MALRNHKIVKRINSLVELHFALTNNKSIYFRPAHRVMPTKFIMQTVWRIPVIEDRIETGCFFEVTPKKDISRQRIKNVIANAKLELINQTTYQSN